MHDNPVQTLLTLIDLTSLNDDDQDDTIQTLCQKAVTPWGHVAAVCIFPRFVALAKKLLIDSKVKIATVANFPHGNDALQLILTSINDSLNKGASEIDVVFPYQLFLSGKKAEAQEFVARCKTCCGKEVLLKVILETGALPNLETIAEMSRVAIAGGADFLKTSTGKITTGATLDAAEVMLTTIQQTNPKVGFKAAGAIRTIADAQKYLALAEKILGKEWITPQTFRIGASKLMDEVLSYLMVS